jgi:dipeptidyl aminopeptidase/acylaminoacyl peptidase
MTEDDLLRFVWVADPRISPDGTRVAFTRVWVDREADEYRTQVWISDCEGGGARPLTSGGLDAQPRWSPDGQWLAFVRKPEARKPGQIFVLPLEGGEATAVTALEGGASDPAWSPDSRRLAFLSSHNPAVDLPDRKKPVHEAGRIVTRPVFRENDLGFQDDQHRDHVWVVGREGGQARALTRGRIPDGAPQWSRDGRWILFVADRRPEPWFGLDQSRLYAVSCDLDSPTEGDALQVAVEAQGTIAAFAEGDDGQFALIAPISETFHSYEQPRLLVAAGRWPRSATPLAAGYDFPFGEGINSDQHPPRGGGQVPLGFIDAGAGVIALAARHGAGFLARVDPASGEVTELTPAGFDIVSGTGTPDGRSWALVAGSPDRPGDLWWFDAASRAMRRLWSPNEELLCEAGLGEVEEFWYPSFDGRRIQGWIVKPPDFDPSQRYPMVLEIHGGPHTAYGMGFFHEFQVLAAAGYVVLYTNPRGSTSYGQEFANIIQFRFPDEDARDLMAGVDAVLARGYVDEHRLGVTGGSGGGLLTNWLITQTGCFAAAITQRCVSDWSGMYSSCDFAMYTPFWFRKPPFEDAEEWRTRSPLTYVERVTTPLMVIHSEEDWRTPIAQGEAMFRALKHLGKPTVMVRFPGESHELSRSGAPSRRVENQQHIRRWFDHWLMGKPAPEYEV